MLVSGLKGGQGQSRRLADKVSLEGMMPRGASLSTLTPRPVPPPPLPPALSFPSPLQEQFPFPLSVKGKKKRQYKSVSPSLYPLLPVLLFVFLSLTFSHHSDGETLHEATSLAGLPSAFGDLTFVGCGAAVLNIAWEQKRRKKREEREENMKEKILLWYTSYNPSSS